MIRIFILTKIKKRSMINLRAYMDFCHKDGKYEILKKIIGTSCFLKLGYSALHEDGLRSEDAAMFFPNTRRQLADSLMSRSPFKMSDLQMVKLWTG